jgi:hypothetical protein
MQLTTKRCVLDKLLLIVYVASSVAFCTAVVMAPERPKQAQSSDQAATASYLASMAATMAAMARSEGLDTLGYLFEMARLEAENSSR